MAKGSQRGLRFNRVLAPEEPNVYSTDINHTTCAPAERNVSGNDKGESRPRVAPLERGGVFGGRAFYKHFIPTGRGSVVSLSSLRKQ